jgi:hypothetical protein
MNCGITVSLISCCKCTDDFLLLAYIRNLLDLSQVFTALTFTASRVAHHFPTPPQLKYGAMIPSCIEHEPGKSVAETRRLSRYYDYRTIPSPFQENFSNVSSFDLS